INVNNSESTIEISSIIIASIPNNSDLLVSSVTAGFGTFPPRILFSMQNGSFYPQCSEQQPQSVPSAGNLPFSNLEGLQLGELEMFFLYPQVLLEKSKGIFHLTISPTHLISCCKSGIVLTQTLV